MAIIGGVTPEQTRSQLNPWFAQHFGGARIAAVSVPSGNGKSTDTQLVELDDGRRVVVRIEPATHRVVYSYDLAREARVMNAVAAGIDRVPAPRVLAHEPDAGVLGSPFLVLERLDGRTPGDEPPFPVDSDSWVLALSDGERAALYDNALQVLAVIHAADWRALGLHGLARPELGDDPLTQHIAWWRAFYAWGSAGRPCRTIEETLDWLERERPDDPGPTVLCWGDSRLGNLMFDADGTVSGVLDWELAALGPAGLDLGWWLFCDRHHSEAIGAPWPGGFPSRHAVLARYAELTGTPIPDDDWYEIYGGLRFAILMNRAGNMLIDAGVLPPEATMATNNPATQALARLIGADPPHGKATSFLAEDQPEPAVKGS